MVTDSDTFEFYDAAPEQLALDLLQDCDPRASKAMLRSTAKKALKISSDCLPAWLMLARNYQLFPRARNTYLDALAVADKQEKPDHLSRLALYKELGDRYYAHGDFSTAAETYRKGLGLDDSDPLSISSALALAYLEQDMLDEAEALTKIEPFHSTLSAKVAQTYILFRKAMPEWSADQLEELDYQLLNGITTWQWMHGKCDSLKRHYRALNHSNPFLTFFLLNPYCTSIELPEKVVEGRASDALAVAQAHQHLWQYEALPLRLLEEFPWTNPLKREILAEDKPLLKATIAQLEEYREELRTEAERDYLGDNELY